MRSLFAFTAYFCSDFTFASVEDCSRGDAACLSALGEGSHCKYWSFEPHCHGSNLPCACDGSLPIAPELSSSSEPVVATVLISELALDCTDADRMCKEVSGDSRSYCKGWSIDPHCHGHPDLRCNCVQAVSSETSPASTETTTASSATTTDSTDTTTVSVTVSTSRRRVMPVLNYHSTSTTDVPVESTETTTETSTESTETTTESTQTTTVMASGRRRRVFLVETFEVSSTTPAPMESTETPTDSTGTTTESTETTTESTQTTTESTETSTDSTETTIESTETSTESTETTTESTETTTESRASTSAGGRQRRRGRGGR